MGLAGDNEQPERECGLAAVRWVVGLPPARAVGGAVFFCSRRRRHTKLQGGWSSDVCSSDLEERSRRAATATTSLSRGTSGAAGVETGGAMPAPLLRRADRVTRAEFTLGGRRFFDSVRAAQIGRGSCRGRGEISVVAVSFKKK